MVNGRKEGRKGLKWKNRSLEQLAKLLLSRHAPSSKDYKWTDDADASAQYSFGWRVVFDANVLLVIAVQTKVIRTCQVLMYELESSSPN